MCAGNEVILTRRINLLQAKKTSKINPKSYSKRSVTVIPRMSKSRKAEWSYFLNERNRISYNKLCRRCMWDCKQSFRAIVLSCPYKSKRSVKDSG